jgi:hypothetical protein
MTDRSRPLWKALDAWMDLAENGELEEVDKLILVATDRAPGDSSAALLRAEARDIEKADQQLLLVARGRMGLRR